MLRADEATSVPIEPSALTVLIAKAKAHAEAKSELLRTYIFEQHEVSEVSKPNGKVTDRTDRVVLLVPAAWGVEEILLKVDGREATEKEQKPYEKRNHRRRERWEERRRRAEEQGEEAPGPRSSLTELVELLNRTDYRVVGREIVEGRELLCIEFDPPETVDAKGAEKKIFQHMAGTACLDRLSGEPVRFDVGNTGKFRLRAVVGVKEVSLSLRLKRINDEIWLPESVHFQGLASILGVKRRVNNHTSYGNYRKATVETSESVAVTPEELQRILAEESP